ncbi:MAG: ribonuclease HI [Candidatus Marinimicrobia bacterium]|nr:ribonuclease HI [Candidatus Neomarinimicrobiota bacterium]
MSKKVYAVFQGHQPGLFDSWDEASLQVKGFKGATYKSFPSQAAAIAWLWECVLNAKEPVAQILIDLIKAQTDNGSNTSNLSLTKPNGKIIIHTDGGASPNPGVGGYGVVLQQGKRRKELSAGYQLTTNNRMEMMAVIVALQSLNGSSEVLLHTDSKYVVDSITKRWVYGWKQRGWKKSDGKRPVNVDLWEVLIELLDGHQVEFRWVKGHAGNIENERCDALVTEARKMKNLLVDTGYKAF